MPNTTLRGRAQDLTGRQFGRLVALRPSGSRRSRSIEWECACSCGNTKLAGAGELMRGNVRSCGCLAKDMTSKRSRTHGRTNDPTYRSWHAMRARCRYETHVYYQRYGGRGIRVCERWQNSFDNFLQDMGERPGVEYSIERRDSDGNYEPSNCYWMLKARQSRNKSDNVWLDYGGRSMLLTDWAREMGIKKSTLWGRISRLGWSTERALETPVKSCACATRQG